jgi:uncharacterized damage-inducible protein DinB
MIAPHLYPAVLHLARLTKSFSAADLEQPWAWGPHDEGVRFALLGTYQELQQCAVEIQAARTAADRPVTPAQQILAQYHTAFRELEAVLLGVTEEQLDERPGPGEWPLRRVLGHIVAAERAFFSLVADALQRVRQNEERSPALPAGAVERYAGPAAEFEAVLDSGRLPDIWAYYTALHDRALDEFAGITDAELDAPSLWWEELNLPVRHRLHRFTAHLIQHTIQVEKTLAAIGRPVTEAQMMLRRLFQALAAAEGGLIGAPETGRAARVALAEIINERTAEVGQRVDRAHQLLAAIAAEDEAQIRTLLAENPVLGEVVGENRLTLVLNAAYQHKPALVEMLVESGAYLGIHEAAATGRLDIVQEKVGEWAGWRDRINVDGFNPLQLACYFGQEAVALWLIEQGSNVDVAAQNGSEIRPVHAAAASGSLPVLAALLAKGAEVNAAQQGGYTPLHQAAHRGDEAMARLFLEHGADRTLANDQGQTPRDVALVDGHPDLAAILDPAG